MSHETYPHPYMAFIGLGLTVAGAAVGRTGLPFAEILQYTAWTTGILAAIGSMFKINYRKYLLMTIRKFLNKF